MMTDLRHASAIRASTATETSASLIHALLAHVKPTRLAPTSAMSTRVLATPVSTSDSLRKKAREKDLRGLTQLPAMLTSVLPPTHVTLMPLARTTLTAPKHVYAMLVFTVTAWNALSTPALSVRAKPTQLAPMSATSTLAHAMPASTSASRHMKAPEKAQPGRTLLLATSMSALLPIPAMLTLDVPTMTTAPKAANAMTAFTEMDTSATSTHVLLTHAKQILLARMSVTTTNAPVTPDSTLDLPHMKAPEMDRAGPIPLLATLTSVLPPIRVTPMPPAPTMPMELNHVSAILVSTVMASSAS
jgi:hypothetical protein